MPSRVKTIQVADGDFVAGHYIHTGTELQAAAQEGVEGRGRTAAAAITWWGQARIGRGVDSVDFMKRNVVLNLWFIIAAARYTAAATTLPARRWVRDVRGIERKT